MFSVIKGINKWRQLSPNVHKVRQLSAFESSSSPKRDMDLRESEEYMKDLPDQSLANPYRKAKRVCILCKYGIEVDYKNVQLLSQFVSPYTGRLYDKHITGLCERQQRVLEKEHKKAIQYSLISAAFRDPKYSKDPKLFDPTRPQRPNPY